MQIEVNKVEVVATGKYKTCTAYYRMGSKEYTKKVVSFGDNKPVFDVLTTQALPGVFEIEIDEDSQYKNWVKATPIAKQMGQSAEVGKAPTASLKSTYETPEERAQRQVYIARQSSLERASEYYQELAPDVVKILELTDIYVTYVMEGLDKALQKLAEGSMTKDELVFQKIKELENDVLF